MLKQQKNEHIYQVCSNINIIKFVSSCKVCPKVEILTILNLDQTLQHKVHLLGHATDIHCVG